MRWYCFKFWFYYRLILACLAHINWLTAIYVNCAYFVLWKSYDLLWFWMHFVLCSCFVPLRSENYLLVWCNLVHKRFSKYPDQTYKEIYVLEYGRKRGATKSERDLYQLDKEEAKENEEEDEASNVGTSNLTSPQPMSVNSANNSVENDHTSVTDVSTEIGSSSEAEMAQKASKRKSRLSHMMVIGEEERDCMEHIYVGYACDSASDFGQYEQVYSHFGNKAYADIKQSPVPPLRKKRKREKIENGTQTSSEPSSEQEASGHWYEKFVKRPGKKHKDVKQRSDPDQNVKGGSSSGGNTADEEGSAAHLLKNGIRKILPKAIQHKETSPLSIPPGWEQVLLRPLRQIMVLKDHSQKSGDDAEQDSSKWYDAGGGGEQTPDEKREKKELAKRMRERRRLQLLALAKKEAKARHLSGSIELLLQLLRMVSSFALLVGNIRKTFLPASIRYVKPGQVEHPIMFFFRCTVFLDVLLFWTSIVWAYCLQWHLCCRLGLLKFWLWTFTLVVVGAFAMVFPMSYVQKNLDPSWCRFLPNSTFANYQPDW